MADNEAEQAYLQAQDTSVDATEPVAAEEQAGNDNDDGYDPSRTLDDQYQPTQADLKQDEDVDATAASNPNESSDPTADQVGDAPDPSQTPSRAESTSTPVPPSGASVQPQTRTIGGFVDEDDDEDDKDEADYEPPAALGVDDTNAMPMTMSEDPSSGNAIQNTSPDVSQPVQGSASVQDVANSSYSPAPVPNIDPSVPGQVQLAVHDASMQNSTPTPVPDSPSAARGRLPHDRVGILQDRVDEDPRGDIAAWLELIAEHRSRNRLDSAREVYERFLNLFPMAVSSFYSHLTILLC
jgi:cleavage stimulation factor subunit 3